MVPGRAALAVWLGKLDLCDLGEGDSPDVPGADERMMNWIVLSVKSGWTPGEVLLWLFPSLRDTLFDMIRDETGSTLALFCAASMCSFFVVRGVIPLGLFYWVDPLCIHFLVIYKIFLVSRIGL